MPATLARNSCAPSPGDAELFQWILEQVRTAFRLRSWQQDDRKAERLAQRVWCALEREERRCYTFARQLGKRAGSGFLGAVLLSGRCPGRRGDWGARNKPGICREINR